MITNYNNCGIGNQLLNIFCAISYSKDNNKEFKFSKIQCLNHNNSFDKLFKYLPRCNRFIKNEIQEKSWNEYTPIPLLDNNCIIKGYRQNIHYFIHNLEYIKNQLNIQAQINDMKNKYKLFNEPFCCLHIRLGDKKFMQKYYNILNVDYYIDAIKNIQSKIIIYIYEIEDSRIIYNHYIKILRNIFKDKIFLNIYSLTMDEYEQYLFMCMSNENIISNSTFSLTASFLNNSKNIYYPSLWDNSGLDINLFKDEWKKIDVKTTDKLIFGFSNHLFSNGS